MNKKMNNKGFSLVELIVVIAIMAVLIGVLAPQFIKYVEKSRQSTDITNLDSCVSAVKVYYTDHELSGASTITIKANGSGYFEASPSNAALTDVNAENTKVKGKWDTTAIEADITVTGSGAGTIVYKGESEYYKSTGDKFEAKP